MHHLWQGMPQGTPEYREALTALHRVPSSGRHWFEQHQLYFNLFVEIESERLRGIKALASLGQDVQKRNFADAFLPLIFAGYNAPFFNASLHMTLVEKIAEKGSSISAPCLRLAQYVNQHLDDRDHLYEGHQVIRSPGAVINKIFSLIFFRLSDPEVVPFLHRLLQALERKPKPLLADSIFETMTTLVPSGVGNINSDEAFSEE